MEYSWAVDLPLITNPKEGQTQFFIGQNEVDDVSTRVNSFESPNVMFETKKNMIGSSYFYTVANNDRGNISMRVDEMEDGLTMAYFELWKNSIMNERGMYYPPATYKKTIKHVRLSNTGEDIHFTRFIGFFPTSISPISYSYEGTGIVQYNISFSGDKIEHYIVPTGEIRTAINAAQDSFIGRGKPGFGRLNIGGGINNEIADIALRMGNSLKSVL